MPSISEIKQLYPEASNLSDDQIVSVFNDYVIDNVASIYPEAKGLTKDQVFGVIGNKYRVVKDTPFNFDENKSKIIEALKMNGLDSAEDREFEYNRMRSAGKLDADIANALGDATTRLANRQRSIGQTAKDSLLDLGVGSGELVRGAGWLASHLHEESGKGIQQIGENAADYYRQKQSGELKAMQEKVGDAKGFVGTVKALVQNPGVVLSDSIQSIPGMAVGMGAGSVAERAIVNQMIERGIASGMSRQAATEAALKAAEGTFTKAGLASIGTNAATEALQTAGSTGADIEKFALERGLTEEEARSLANSTAVKAGLIDLPFSMIGGGVERRFVKGDLEKGLKGAILNPLKEGAEEFGQSAGEEYFTKKGMQQVDPSIQPDPWGAGVRGMAAGFGTGAAMHIAGGGLTPEDRIVQSAQSIQESEQTKQAAQQAIPNAPTVDAAIDAFNVANDAGSASQADQTQLLADVLRVTQSSEDQSNASKSESLVEETSQANDAQVGAELAAAPANEGLTTQPVVVAGDTSVQEATIPPTQAEPAGVPNEGSNVAQPATVAANVSGAVESSNVKQAYNAQPTTTKPLKQTPASLTIPTAIAQRVSTKTDAELNLMAKTNPDQVVQEAVKAEQAKRQPSQQQQSKDKRAVNPSADSALVAIAKLGGIDTQELLGNGFDQSDISVQKGARVKKDGQLGKAPFRAKQVGFNLPIHRNGGLSFDGMREMLVQHGYLPEGASKNDMIDLFRRSLTEDVHTPQATEQAALEAAEARDAEMEAAQAAGDYNGLTDQQENVADEVADSLINDREAFARGLRLAGFSEDEINEQIYETFKGRESDDVVTDGSTSSSSIGRDQEGTADAEIYGGKESQEPDWLSDGFGLEGQTNEEASAEYMQQQDGETNAISKEQADREQAAVPFTLATESQPKPVGVQGDFGIKFSKATSDFQQSPDADREFAETERAYGGRESHDRAVENGKTKLNYRQWVQVRTPRFKAWFGDWEIASSVPNRQASTFDDARLAAKAFQGKPLENTITGMKAVVSRNNLDKMLNSKAVSKSESAQSHSFAVANLDYLFSSALIGWSKPDADGDPNIKAIHRFFAPVVRDGQAMLAKMTVKETAIENDPNPLYTVEAVEFNEKSPAAQWVAAASSADGVNLNSIRSAGDIISLANRVQNFNGEVSKVRDPQTGEPLVVYHGTGYDFGEDGSPVAFRDDRAIMITPSPGYANKFAFYGKANVMPLFANIRNPISTEDQNKAEDLPYWQDIEELRAGENDGLIYSKKGNILKGASGWGDDIPQYAVFSPEQLKSAIGNNGDFNPNTRDVRHSKGTTTSTPLPQQTAERLIASELGSTTLAKVLVDSGIVSFANSEEELKKLGGKLMVAWHGSPHDHDGFTTAKIGTGEGAQAYGWGLYFASAKEIGEYYRDSLRGKSSYDLSEKAKEYGFELNAGQRGEIVRQVTEGKEKGRSANQIARYAQFAKSSMRDINIDSLTSLVQDYIDNGFGRLYQVELAPSEDEYLDWDKPLSEQSKKVKKLINKWEKEQGGWYESGGRGVLISAMTGRAIYGALSSLKRSDKAASDYLHSIGIRGIRYLDGTSRGAGEGSSNYVIFSDEDVSITAKYAKDQQILGATLPDGRIILNLGALTEQNFAGVFQHEGFHSTIRELVGEETYSKLMRQLELNLKAAKGNDWVTRANAAIPSDTKAEDRTEEIGAYAIEQFINGEKQPNFVKRWVNTLLSAIRTAIIQRMPNGKLQLWAMKNLKPQDLASLAIAGLKAKARGQLQAQGRAAMAYSQEQTVFDAKKDKDGFWRKLYLKGNFTAQEVIDAIQTGKRGTNRDGRFTQLDIYKGDRGSSETEMFGRGIINFDNEVSKFNGYFTVAERVNTDLGRGFLVWVVPNDLFIGKSFQSIQDLDDSAITQYLFTDIGNNQYRLDVHGVYENSSAYHELERRGDLHNHGNTPEGDTYWGPKLGATTEGVLMQEAVRRLGLTYGKVPDKVIQMGRDTGIRAGSREVREFGRDSIVSRFSRNNPDIRYSKASPQQPNALPEETKPQAAFDLPEWTKRDTVQERIQDRYNRIRDVVKAIRKQGLVNDVSDFDMGEDRFHGVAMAKIEAIEEDVVSLLKAAKAAEVSLEEVTMYAYAEHAPERNKAMQAINPNVKTGSGMSETEAADIIAKAKQEGKDSALSKIADNMRSIAKRTLKAQLDAGLIEQSEYDNYTNKYQKWVPLRGFETIDEDGRTFRGTGKGFNIRGKENLRALGRDSKAGQILENIAMDAERTAIRSTKNVEVNHRFLRFVLDNPDPTLWEIDSTKTKQAMKNGRVSLDSMIDKGDNTIGIKVNGQVVYVKIHDQKLFEQLANMWNDSEFGAIPYLGEIQRYLAKSYTAWSPEFALFTNPVRDITAAFVSITGREGIGMTGLFAKNYAAALKAAYQSEVLGKKSPIYAEYEAMGGKTGFWNVSTLQTKKEEIESLIKDMENAKLRNAWRTPLKLAKALEKIVSHHAGALENATRLASYMAMKEAGKSKEDAANFAKNLNVNFNRRGTWTSGLGSIFLFFNPAVQGTHNMYSTLVNGKHNKQALALMGTGIAGMFMLALMNAGAGDDDDGIAWWDKISDYEKQTNVIIVLPGYMKGIGEQIKDSTGRYIKFPMPYGWNAPFYGGVVAADVMRNTDDPATGMTAGKGSLLLGQAAVKAFNPVGIPQAVAPFWQHYTNEGPFGGRLYPESQWNKNKPGSEKYSAAMQGSPWQQWAAFVNEATGGNKYQAGVVSLPPAVWRNYMRSFIGGPMSFATAVNDSISEGDITKAPFFRKAYGEVDFNEDAGKYYGISKKAEALYDAAKSANKAGDTELAKSIIESDKVMFTMGAMAEDYDKRLGETFKEESRLKKSVDLTDKERALKLKMNELRRSNIQEEYLKKWRMEMNGLR